MKTLPPTAYHVIPGSSPSRVGNLWLYGASFQRASYYHISIVSLRQIQCCKKVKQQSITNIITIIVDVLIARARTCVRACMCVLTGKPRWLQFGDFFPIQWLGWAACKNPYLIWGWWWPRSEGACVLWSEPSLPLYIIIGCSNISITIKGLDKIA